MSRTTASHHLTALARRSWITRERLGRTVRHYVVDEEPAAARLRPYLEVWRSRAIVEVLVHSPAGTHWTVNSLANEVGCYHAFLLRVLRGMERHGFVNIVRPRGRYYVSASSKLWDIAPRLLAALPQMQANDPEPEGGT